MKAVYKTCCDFGRMGFLSGVFVADTDNMNKLKQTNPVLCFGDVLGKHSDITNRFNDWDLEEVTDPAAVSVVERLGLQNGVDLWNTYMDSPMTDSETESSTGSNVTQCSTTTPL